MYFIKEMPPESVALIQRISARVRGFLAPRPLSHSVSILPMNIFLGFLMGILRLNIASELLQCWRRGIYSDLIALVEYRYFRPALNLQFQLKCTVSRTYLATVQPHQR